MSASRASRFCHLCGQPLGGRYYRYAHGLVVCVACKQSRPACAHCGVPLADADMAHAVSTGAAHPAGGSHRPSGESGTQLLCRRCLRAAPRCACCGQPIAQTWYTFEELLPPSAARRYCERCVRTYPRCDICRAPVALKAPTLPDGQFRCPLCATEMVVGDAAVRAVYDESLACAERVAGIRPAQTPDLMVVGRRQMGDVRMRFAYDVPDGVPGHHVLGFYVRDGGRSTIYVELGLPRPLLLGTLAHELAHAWQVEVAPNASNPFLREGFAEWVSHHVLVAAGHRRVAARATRRDDLYGKGLRHFLAIEREEGRDAVLQAAREVQRGPLTPTRGR
jgi:hypothetical protein